ncbi:MAG: hypothetical protein V3W41_21240 [Planctomycetota bacterium]
MAARLPAITAEDFKDDEAKISSEPELLGFFLIDKGTERSIGASYNRELRRTSPDSTSDKILEIANNPSFWCSRTKAEIRKNVISIMGKMNRKPKASKELDVARVHSEANEKLRDQKAENTLKMKACVRHLSGVNPPVLLERLKGRTYRDICEELELSPGQARHAYEVQIELLKARIKSDRELRGL